MTSIINNYNIVYGDITALFNELFPITKEYFSQIPEGDERNAFHNVIKNLFLKEIQPNVELFNNKTTYYFNDGFDFTITNGSFLYDSSKGSVDIDSNLSIKLISKKDSSKNIDITIDKESFKNPKEILTQASKIREAFASR
jgi:hypothetical protein